MKDEQKISLVQLAIEWMGIVLMVALIATAVAACIFRIASCSENKYRVLYCKDNHCP